MIREQIINIVMEVSGLDEVDSTKSLTDLGCDSIDLAEIETMIEDDTGVVVSNLSNFKTLDEIIALVESKG